MRIDHKNIRSLVKVELSWIRADIRFLAHSGSQPLLSSCEKLPLKNLYYFNKKNAKIDENLIKPKQRRFHQIEIFSTKTWEKVKTLCFQLTELAMKKYLIQKCTLFSKNQVSRRLFDVFIDLCFFFGVCEISFRSSLFNFAVQ